MIYQFPEFVSQYKDRYPHSVKSEVKWHLNHLKLENVWETQFSQQKSGLSNYTIYFYSKITFRQVLLSHTAIWINTLADWYISNATFQNEGIFAQVLMETRLTHWSDLYFD